MTPTWLGRRSVEIAAVFAAGAGLGIGVAAVVSPGNSGNEPHAAAARRTHAHTTGKATTSAAAPAAAGAPPPATAVAVLRRGSHASFQRLNAELGANVELAVQPLGEGAGEVLGEDAPAHGWSTTKVPVLTALLRARGAEGLTSEEQTWAQAAITESSNEAVLALFKDLEQIEGGLVAASSYIDHLLLESGDDETHVATAPPPPNAVTTFGQTEWRPSEAVRFFSALGRGCLLSKAKTQYVLGLMSNIEPSESWGLGEAGFASVAFKGGWGPEPRERYAELVRQSGIVEVGSDRAVAVSIVAFASSFENGTEILTRTAKWLREHLAAATQAAAPCANR